MVKEHVQGVIDNLNFLTCQFSMFQSCLVVSIIPLTIDDVMTKERLMTNGFSRVEHSIIGEVDDKWV